MEPRIQYAKTTDGVSIAYWTLGEGMPLVQMPTGPFSNIQREWQWPEWRHFYERLAEKRMLVRYDGRGTGLSERDVSDYSLDARVLDLEAIVDRLGLERFALGGTGDFGPVAIAYRCAETDPNTVSTEADGAGGCRNNQARVAERVHRGLQSAPRRAATSSRRG